MANEIEHNQTSASNSNEILSQEFPHPSELNAFHSSADARDFSYKDKGSSKASDEAAQNAGATGSASVTSTTAASGVAAGVGATTAAVAGVVVGVITLAPKVFTMPTIANFSTAISETSVSFSFQCNYVASGKLYVHLSSSFGIEEKSYDLVLPAVSSDSSSSSNSSSSGVYSQGIEGIFSGLRANHNYVISILANATENTMTTLKSQAFVSSSAGDGSLSIMSTSVDYAASSLVYTLSVTDPGGYFIPSSFFSEAEGQDATGSSVTNRGELIQPLTSSQTFSLAGFKKGYYLRFSIWGASSYGVESSITPDAKKLAEVAVYY